jgi:hypothetical protein
LYVAFLNWGLRVPFRHRYFECAALGDDVITLPLYRLLNASAYKRAAWHNFNLGNIAAGSLQLHTLAVFFAC